MEKLTVESVSNIPLSDRKQNERNNESEEKVFNLRLLRTR